MIHNRNTNFNRHKEVIFRVGVHNKNAFKSVRPTHSLDVANWELWHKIQNGILAFCHNTTIHGIVYLAKRGLHLIER